MKINIILQNIGTKKCIEKAAILAKVTAPIQTLHLRDLDLKIVDIRAISDCLNEEEHLKSISLSYNSIGDLGTIVLVENLPKSITEIGLVNCGITDVGGMELLKYMKKSPQLQMVCIEENHFSVALRIAFQQFNKENTQILFVF